MDVRVKATEYELTPDTSSYLDDRLAHIEKILGKNSDNVRCEVELGRDAGRPRHGKNIFFAEMRVIIPGEKGIYATNHSESVNGAIDDVQQEISRQIKRTHKLHSRFIRKSGAMMKRLMKAE